MKRGIWALVLVAVAGAQAPRFDELSAKARQAYEANKLEEAAGLFGQAVKLRPQWVEGWWALGMIEYQRDRYPQCQEALTKMTALDSGAAPGLALLGLCEFRNKHYDLAFQHLKRAHMLVPVQQGSTPLLDMADFHLAMLLTRQGAFEVAHEVMVRVALKVRSNPSMMFACGLPSLRMPILPDEVPENQKDVVAMAGKAFWDIATRPPEEGAVSIKALVEKYPKFPNVHYFYGTYMAAHFPEQSAPAFLEELKVSPDHVPSRVQLVLRYLTEQRLDEALKVVREAMALSPDSVGVHLAYAQTLRARGDDEGALAAFLEAKRLDPVSPKIRLYVVNSYRALGRLEEMRRAQAEYEKVRAEQANWP